MNNEGVLIPCPRRCSHRRAFASIVSPVIFLVSGGFLVLPISLAGPGLLFCPQTRASWTEDERIVLFSPDGRAL